jgi:hypothetical protein
MRVIRVETAHNFRLEMRVIRVETAHNYLYRWLTGFSEGLACPPPYREHDACDQSRNRAQFLEMRVI